MKIKKIVCCVILVLLVVGIGIGSIGVYKRFLYKDSYLELNHIDYDSAFSQGEDDYYVYYFLEGCPDCNAIQKEIRGFSKTNMLYVVDAYDIIQNGLRYDWENHNESYDIEIGKLNGRKTEYYDEKYAIQLLDGKTIDLYGYPAIYIEKTANRKYISNNQNAEAGLVYASLQTPVINYSVHNASELIVALYPTLLHIQNGEVVGFYYDAPEIRTYIENGGGQ